MTPATNRPVARLAMACVLLAATAGRASGADVEPAVRTALQFLSRSAPGAKPGEAALAALAMLKADVPPTDPALAACLARVDTLFTSGGGYTPKETGGHDIYEAAVALMAMAYLDPAAQRARIEAAAGYLIAKQKANGSWDYPQREFGDTSISQYAVLGLWEAENVGVAVPPRLWDDAAAWFLSVQGPQGSWNYHRDEQGPETLSMTAAGVGSLLICQRQLAGYRRQVDAANPFLVPMTAGPQARRYEPKVAHARIGQAAQRGISWISTHFNLSQNQGAAPGQGSLVGPSPTYGLYGIERIGALADRESLGAVNWFEQGARFLLSTQGAGGNWTSTYGDVPSTSWAVLFMVKSTKRSIERVQIKKLGAGTLLGGRGLPKDLSSLTVAQGRVVVRPMNGAVEGMLEVLADPRTEEADSALAGLIERYRVGGSKVLLPHRDRFVALMGDRDPGVRRVAAWGLARLGELDQAPRLIEALRDPDEGVVSEARLGLQLLSRKLDGFGPPPGASPEQVEQAVRAWQAWYESARPLEADLAAEPPAASPAPAPRRARP